MDLQSGGLVGVALTLAAWLYRQSQRLTAAEVRIEGQQRAFESHQKQVLDSLQRIEDKIDRKVDKRFER
ncbi:hypothetical protein SAMN04487785_102401 [Dyella jiangningensis]|uniref:hypothetical protein n=1 Tax=Dyella sp. AtDHG13 TaxID=1938897 RepID=UPI000890C85A|nr:hypothetical protein [Dyella sp. AtDHG13]PXV60673.1 hypothetical protein BDW41_102400 [Dyella sp. AtDHG13]SDJ54614.1 hypothetical protein SAMN04487785_102401 [Dyella jiangningensis]